MRAFTFDIQGGGHIVVVAFDKAAAVAEATEEIAEYNRVEREALSLGTLKAHVDVTLPGASTVHFDKGAR